MQFLSIILHVYYTYVYAYTYTRILHIILSIVSVVQSISGRVLKYPLFILY